MDCKPDRRRVFVAQPIGEVGNLDREMEWCSGLGHAFATDTVLRAAAFCRCSWIASVGRESVEFAHRRPSSLAGKGNRQPQAGRFFELWPAALATSACRREWHPCCQIVWWLRWSQAGLLFRVCQIVHDGGEGRRIILGGQILQAADFGFDIRLFFLRSHGWCRLLSLGRQSGEIALSWERSTNRKPREERILAATGVDKWSFATRGGCDCELDCFMQNAAAQNQKVNKIKVRTNFGLISSKYKQKIQDRQWPPWIECTDNFQIISAPSIFEKNG